jgi:hypothetical protein
MLCNDILIMILITIDNTMKTNKLCLTKTISDFMFLWLENPEEKAKKIFIMKTLLTAHGFEMLGPPIFGQGVK